MLSEKDINKFNFSSYRFYEIKRISKYDFTENTRV